MDAIKKILIFSVNPKDTPQVRLDEEVDEIEEVLRRSKYRERFDIKKVGAVKRRDLHREMLDFQPQIVHFCCHGKEDGLQIENETGNAVVVTPKALGELFKHFKDDVECVILNACYSEANADAIAQNIKYVIGMHQTITDKAAIEFAVGFYDALGAGKTYEQAFELGKDVLQEDSIPVLKIKKDTFTQIQTNIHEQGESLGNTIEKVERGQLRASSNLPRNQLEESQTIVQGEESTKTISGKKKIAVAIGILLVIIFGVGLYVIFPPLKAIWDEFFWDKGVWQ